MVILVLWVFVLLCQWGLGCSHGKRSSCFVKDIINLFFLFLFFFMQLNDHECYLSLICNVNVNVSLIVDCLKDWSEESMLVYLPAEYKHNQLSLEL